MKKKKILLYYKYQVSQHLKRTKILFIYLKNKEYFYLIILVYIPNFFFFTERKRKLFFH